MSSSQNVKINLTDMILAMLLLALWLVGIVFCIRQLMNDDTLITYKDAVKYTLYSLIWPLALIAVLRVIDDLDD